MARKSERLDTYRQKRSFEKTPEPTGKPQPKRRRSSKKMPDRFVVQEHHARRLHWDLRLERNGVLVSWALPRGFPDTPDENRLAVHTEDHPLEYLTFEGDIPAGEYGGGKMTVWDTGTYDAEKFTGDKVVLRFDGKRVQGRYALFQTRDRDWMIHRMDPPESGRDPMPEDIVPMAATLSHLPARDEGWGYEIKWDGVRAIGYAEPGRLRLVSRTLRDVTAQYPEIGPMTRDIGARHVVLDGEIVAFDDVGRPSFQRLQPRMHVKSESEIRRRRNDTPVTYVVFDLLYLDGRSLLDTPYQERRRELEALGLGGTSWQVPAYQRGEGRAFLDASRAQGLEGIVAKPLDSTYQPGRRSQNWLKVKNVRRQEVVIGGWVAGQGRREGELGALLVGYYDSDDGTPRLRFAGKVGTGFDAAALRLLRDRLEPLRTDRSPFTGRQPQKDAVFAEPKLVCEVEFSEWTGSGTLRHPSYQGLRDDKPATDVVREVG
jgi:bifunctional non-homologous end joining protein LigD